VVDQDNLSRNNKGREVNRQHRTHGTKLQTIVVQFAAHAANSKRRFTMKRFALNLILGVALAAGSSVSGATTNDPTIKNNSTTTSSGSLTAAVLCALGFTSSCVAPDVTRDPTIVNN
jgi:hypothetical protein